MIVLQCADLSCMVCQLSHEVVYLDVLVFFSNAMSVGVTSVACLGGDSLLL